MPPHKRNHALNPAFLPKPGEENMGRNGLGGSGRATPSVGCADHSRILVVAASPVNRIVISRMLERIYLKPTAVDHEAALEAFVAKCPAMVIIDEGQQTNLDALIEELASRRQSHMSNLPRIVLIAEPSQQGSVRYEGLVDAVVAKPITPEILQPVVERLAKDGAI